MRRQLFKIMLFLLFISTTTLLWFQQHTSSLENDQTPLKIGMYLNTPPFEGLNSSGKPEGASVALAQALGQYLNRPIEIVNLPRKTLRTALLNEKIDLILSSYTIHNNFSELQFSDPYAHRPLVMLAYKESKVTNFDTLNSPEVVIAVTKRSYASRWAMYQIPQAQIKMLADTDTAIREVAEGKADVLISDPITVINAQSDYPDTTALLLEPLPNTSGWGIATNPKTAVLLPKINAFLAQAKKDGTFESIRNTYLKNEIEIYRQYQLEYFF